MFGPGATWSTEGSPISPLYTSATLPSAGRSGDLAGLDAQPNDPLPTRRTSPTPIALRTGRRTQTPCQASTLSRRASIDSERATFVVWAESFRTERHPVATILRTSSLKGLGRLRERVASRP